jgi:maltooligosyltrehalose trehalohydrolase
MTERPQQGAVPSSQGVRYTTWAPQRPAVRVIIVNERGQPLRDVTLDRIGQGFHTGIDATGKAGDLYYYSLGEDEWTPDIASRYQPQGVGGPSMALDLQTYQWKHAPWNGIPLQDLVIYELHVGTFTPEGTFAAAEGKLPHLKKLGATAIQLMPLGDFPGNRNWGYDGVMPFAPARCYGRPEDLQRLVDAAHAAGLAVIFDVVYNHIGPSGNHFTTFSSAYFTDRHRTLWGRGINFDDEQSGPVRDFFLANVACWLDDYHGDGLRIDSTHSIQDESAVHVLKEIAAAVHARGRFLIAEDERNLAGLVKTAEAEGFDALWADDFHHAMRVALTGDSHSHFASFRGTPVELAEVLNHGWLYRGQEYPHWKRPRGSPASHLPPAAFVHCLSNHDQVGNRPLGERLHAVTSMAAYRAASALLCLTPYTPMLFMGQEWAAASPFYFFTDHSPEFGESIAAGRRKEFATYGCNYDSEVLERMPDPQDARTFHDSKLTWDEPNQPGHAGVLNLYQRCLQLRDEIGAECRQRDRFDAFAAGDSLLGLLYRISHQEAYLLLVALHPGYAGPLPGKGNYPWQNSRIILSTNDAAFGGSGSSAWRQERQALEFEEPEALLLHIS